MKRIVSIVLLCLCLLSTAPFAYAESVFQIPRNKKPQYTEFYFDQFTISIPNTYITYTIPLHGQFSGNPNNYLSAYEPSSGNGIAINVSPVNPGYDFRIEFDKFISEGRIADVDAYCKSLYTGLASDSYLFFTPEMYFIKTIDVKNPNTTDNSTMYIGIVDYHGVAYDIVISGTSSGVDHDIEFVRSLDAVVESMRVIKEK